ncbi:PRC-barrel domain-containing protein [Rhodovulum sp. ES.010]|uniref:PRC-barrel domain-containing protein n=1 Tax=Rhodovulum sp. ES.010 TaxID=1882821 RepID=UPI000926009B|nr:PRC-barrel domain-containing protein [Rhodovulum sp. ES.010]SIO15730.1 PRC-barrel domain-containing protein [Rhodovulum sp. ES.010]
MKTFTASILALAVAAPVALADSQNASENAMGTAQEQTSAGMTEHQGDLVRTRDITGGTIYTLNEANDEGWDTKGTHDEIGADWNSIGEIEDVVLSKNGQMSGVVAEVGGFLDIADKHVLISMADVNLVQGDRYALVTRLNEEELESMEDIDEGFWE